jgi:DNA-directed RNA polymerase subunit F
MNYFNLIYTVIIMTVNEAKNIIQKLIKYSMEELEMAEHYQKMMAHMEDSSAFSKFKEFANQELAHHEYDLSTAMAMAQKLKDENEIADVDEFINDIYKQNQTHWKEKIVWKIANTKPKTSR